MEEILKKACDTLKKDSELCGIILHGSYAKGCSHPNSDIDLFAIYERKLDRVRCYKDEQFVQIIERSFDFFKERLFMKTRTKPYCLDAVVLYDKTGEVTKLMTSAKKEALREGPKKLTEEEINFKQITLSQDIYTIEGLIAVDNFEGATFIMNEILYNAIELYYDFYGYFMVTKKQLIADLKRYDEELADLASLVILSTEIKSKLANLWVIRDKVLELVGGEKLEYEINFIK